MTTVTLREIADTDLSVFFAHQQDPEALFMAAFTAKDPADRTAFDAHWAKILADDSITLRTVLVDGQVAGHISVHHWFGEPEVTYWLGRDYWGQGVATQALSLLLETVETRPIYGRAAADNVASIRVLEKCGFSHVGADRGFAQARKQVIEELILRLES